MKFLPLALIPLVLLAACERNDSAANPPSEPKAGERIHAPAPGKPTASLDVLRRLRDLPADAQPPTLAEHIYHVTDEDLVVVLEELAATEDPDLKQSLFGTLYDETTLRPAFVRLPLLLEIARQPGLRPDLRTSILGELGTALGTDHGSSWGDWALALEEHLAETSGLIRVSE